MRTNARGPAQNTLQGQGALAHIGRPLEKAKHRLDRLGPLDVKGEKDGRLLHVADQQFEHGDKLGSLAILCIFIGVGPERRANGKKKHDYDANEKGDAYEQCDRVIGARDTGKLDPAIRSISWRTYAAQGAHIAWRANNGAIDTRRIARSRARSAPLALDKFSQRTDPLDAPITRHDAQGSVVASCAHATLGAFEALLLFPWQVAGKVLARDTCVHDVI